MGRRGAGVSSWRMWDLRDAVKKARWSSVEAFPDSMAAVVAGSVFPCDAESGCESAVAVDAGVGDCRVQPRLRFLMNGLAMSSGLARRLGVVVVSVIVSHQ